MLKQSGNVLFLIPLPISETDINWSIALSVIEQINKIQCFIVENAKTSRRYLKQLNPNVDLNEIYLLELDKHNINSQFGEIKVLLQQYEVVGLMSEAGLPCIADPGNHVVRMAHDMDITVKPLSGPSSIILALIASGLNGQQFKFNGYLPAKPQERKLAIQALEKESQQSTQLFIEAPYRNDKMLADLLSILKSHMRLLVAIDINGNDEQIICKPVSWWKSNIMEIGKIPCLFGIGI
jgi:16S rRNA (cytidine1402-2'-O)-methyltransferase